jgi:hypothetical protein
VRGVRCGVWGVRKAAACLLVAWMHVGPGCEGLSALGCAAPRHPGRTCPAQYAAVHVPCRVCHTRQGIYGVAVQEYIRDLERREKEEREREREDKRRSERKARDAFKELLRKHR